MSTRARFVLPLIDAGLFGGRAEEVEDGCFFEGVGAVGCVGREHDGLATDEEFFVFGLGACLAQQEFDAAREDDCDLLVFVSVALDAEAFVQDDAGDHHLVGDDPLAVDERHGRIGWEIGEGDDACVHG